ncbi:MAG: ankyrin repeat domain-containing protein [Isosphaerales bacterium]
MDARFHPAEAALASGDVERLAALLTADPELATARSRLSHPTILQCLVLTMPPVDALEGNALVYAAAWGRAETVDRLLGLGARVNLIPAGFDFAGTPLHYAALRGRRDMVDRLLEHGADPSVRDSKIGKLPEDWAEHDGNRDLSEYLRVVRRQAE